MEETSDRRSLGKYNEFRYKDRLYDKRRLMCSIFQEFLFVQVEPRCIEIL